MVAAAVRRAIPIYGESRMSWRIKRTHEIRWLLALILCLAGGASAVGPEELDQAIERGVGYILANCDQYGRFAYVRYASADKRRGGSYNLLRHCGTIYALDMAAPVVGRPLVAPVIRRACQFLYDQLYFNGVPGQPGMKAIWDIPEKLDGRAPAGSRIVAKLGGAGLGLLALQADQRNQGMTTTAELEGLGAFVLFMQRPDGSFYARYFPDAGYDMLFFSLYYPGEAMLGLVRLYEVDRDKKWLSAAALGMRYLADTRKKTGDYLPDHWGLIASERLMAHLPELEKSPISREILIEHTIGVCKGMLSEQLLDPKSPEYGSFRKGGQTTPTAIRLEGMIAAYRLLPPEQSEIRQQILRACDLGIDFLLKAQFKEGELIGGMPRSVTEVDGEDRAAERDNERMDEVRIDYVQHALSAMLMYRAIGRDIP